MLNLQRILLESKIEEIEYLQLHGSIDWWVRASDNQLVLRDSFQPSRSLRRETYPQQLMVYPIYEKYVSEDPYFTLYYFFRKILSFHDVYVIIGYSFRDPSINNAFGDALRSRSSSRMIIVNNNTRNIQRRIEENFPMSKVDVIQKSFGDDDLPSKLKEYLQ